MTMNDQGGGGSLCKDLAILLCCGEIREGDTPAFMLFVYIRVVAKPIGAVGQMGEILLVVLAIFLEYDFRTNLEKWWKEMRSV